MPKINMSMKIYKISRKLYSHNIPLLPTLFQHINRILFSCDIPYQAEIDDSVIFGHNALGTVIHANAKIGANTLLMHHVTIGGNMDRTRVLGEDTLSAPIIGKNVMVGVGANILGPIIIGDYAQIGSGSVVLEDVPTRGVAVGMPAKVIKTLSESEAIESAKKWS